MKLPPGWEHCEPGWYINEELRTSVCFETATSSPYPGRGWWCYPRLGRVYGPEPTMRRAIALVTANAKEKAR